MREGSMRAVLVAFCTAMMLSIGGPAFAAPCVVLVHGLGRSAASLAPISRSLSSLGYVVINNGYPSTRQTIEASADVVERGLDACRTRGATPIDVVTHSQGGIVLRQYLSDHTAPDLRRVVMLAPPNHGSEIADRLTGKWLYGLATGAAGRQLGTDSGSLPNRLGPAGLAVGVIAGTRSNEPWFASYFHGPNDGKVSVESAKLEGMTDFITVGASHTFMMNSKEVRSQIAAFLNDGRFRR